MKKISIIVPVYNTEKFLERCLSSLLNQSIIELIKVIIVNDGTKDNSEDIILKFTNKYPEYFEYYKQENKGLSIARNLGINKCNTKYIGFLDSDDYLDKYMVEKMYNAIEKNECDIVSCGLLKCDNDGNFIGYEQASETILLDNNKALEYFLDGKIESYACNKIFKTELFKKNNIYYIKGRMYDDIIISYRLIKKAKSVFLIKEPLYLYVQHNDSICHAPNLKTANDILLTLMDVIKEGTIHYGFIARIIILSAMTYYNWYFNTERYEKRCELISEYKNNMRECKKNVTIFNIINNKNIDIQLKIKYLLFCLGILKYISYIRFKIKKRHITVSDVDK